MVKPKTKRKGDFSQVAQGVVADAIKLTGQTIRAPKPPKEPRQLKS